MTSDIDTQIPKIIKEMTTSSVSVINTNLNGNHYISTINKGIIKIVKNGSVIYNE